jgi:CheY-like chemotaxis protein
MLVDDNVEDNFYHERVIRKNGYADLVVSMESGTEAMEYLKAVQEESKYPELIFIDINMPGMNGWEFIKEFNALEIVGERSRTCVMLTTSENPDDITRASELGVLAFKTKPLTKDILNQIIEEFFHE